jgi:hypothetical protein
MTAEHLVCYRNPWGESKHDSRKARINVQRTHRRSRYIQDEEVGNPVVDLMVAVAKTLPEGQFRLLRDQLEDIWS